MITEIDPEIVDDIAQRLCDECNYASLHYEAPDYASAGASELLFGSYVRQEVVWAPVRNGLAISQNQLSWTGLEPPVRIAAIGLCRTLTGNDLVAYGMLTEAVSSAATSWDLPSGSLAIRVV